VGASGCPKITPRLLELNGIPGLRQIPTVSKLLKFAGMELSLDRHRPSVSCRAAAPEKRALPVNSSILVIGAAITGLFLKLLLAYNTMGSNDVVTFYSFARSLNDHGLEATYRHGVAWLPVAPLFNHPPLTAYCLSFIGRLARQDVLQTYGFTFPFLLRLPGIIADFVVVLALAGASAAEAKLRLPRWALIGFALSPVSLMVSGFHGNTDPIMVMFLVLAALMCLHKRPLLCAIFFALSCQIKVIPALFLPIFFFFWFHRRAALSFLSTFALVSLVLWWEPLLKFPLLFAKNVLSYGSCWGIWGITYWLRLTDSPWFQGVSFVDFSTTKVVVMTLLKILIVASVFVIAWRRQAADGAGLIKSIAYAWIVFFVFSPGICAQYMVWLAPFVLVLSPPFYGWVTAASSLFLFFFYNITAHGLPWYLAISTTKLISIWTPWSLWPWIVLTAGLFFLWRRATAANPTLRIFSLEILPLATRPDSDRAPVAPFAA
jgi:hypothetical protein